LIDRMLARSRGEGLPDEPIFGIGAFAGARPCRCAC